MLAFNSNIAYSEGCATCDDNVMWKSHSIQTQVSSCSYVVYYGVRSCPTNINEIKIDSIRAIRSQGCNVNLVLQNAQKEILQSSLSLLNSNPLGGTIRIKKYSCYNDSTYQNCDTNCSSTDYLISRNKNNDSVWYSISQVTNNSNNGACGISGGVCTNKSNNYVSENTILSKFPISQSDNPNDFSCLQECFWTLHGNDNVTNTNYMGSFNDKDVIFKRFASEKMRLGLEGLGILQQNPIEALHIGNYLNFHVGGNYHSLSFNEYYAGNGIRKRWENKYPEIQHDYTPQANGLPQFSGALTFNTSSYNGDGAIELGTAGLGLKEETLNYTESNNLAGHNSGYKGLVIRPTPLNPINNYGLIGLGTYPSENTTRVLIKGMGNDNTTAALNVTNNAGNTKLYVRDDGKIGINNSNPTSLIHLKGLGNTNATSSINIEDNNSNSLLKVKDNGQIDIGGYISNGTNVDYKLAVKGKIVSKEIQVTIDSWSDFVFDKNYILTDLQKVEEYININGHLSLIPSSKDALENGINLGKIQAIMLQKIEELTLYLIAQQKKIKELENLLNK